MLITIKHVPTNKEVAFLPYLTNFSDSFKSDWQQNYVIGRMDPISNFKRTTRTISISFDVLPISVENIKDAKQKMEDLASFLYPVYKEIKTQEKDNINVSAEDLQITNNTLQPTTQNLYKTLRLSTSLEERLRLRPNVSIMSSSPLVSIKFADMISDSKGGPLYGYLQGVDINPIQEMGFYVGDIKGKNIYPKGYSVSLSFTVIHNEPLGWKVDNTKRGGPFRG